MLANLKKVLYFPVASYFRFFAMIRLKRWGPKVIVVTGSSGKTTLLHLIESQLGKLAKYSYHANSSFGIPFDILGLHRSSYKYSEFIMLLIKAPFNTFKKSSEQKFYVVEADCDRPDEGKFLAQLLRPDITLWLNSGKTHSMNFDSKAENNMTVDDLIAYEFGYFVEYCKQLSVINADNSQQMDQIKRAGSEVKHETIRIKDLIKFEVSLSNSLFKTKNMTYDINCLLPEVSFYSLRMTELLLNYLNLPFDPSFKNFKLPPGRATVFSGIKRSTIIDSSYNANLSSMKAILLMFDKLPLKRKWIVLGDMLELGMAEKSEHEELAKIIMSLKPDKVILIGKLVSMYTYPILKDKFGTVKFLTASDSISYFQENITGGEAILFKGSQSIKLEGVIEKILSDAEDLPRLPRQTEFWKAWRRKAGL